MNLINQIKMTVPNTILGSRRFLTIALLITFASLGCRSNAAHAQNQTPWSWELTIYDGYSQIEEVKQFTSRADAEQYLWERSSLDSTLREVNFKGYQDGLAEYEYTGTSYKTNTGGVMHSSRHPDRVSGAWKWYYFRTESEAVNDYREYWSWYWGENQNRCPAMVEEYSGWISPFEPLPEPLYGNVFKNFFITVYDHPSNGCVVDSEYSHLRSGEVNRNRLAEYDWVTETPGNYFVDPYPFTNQPILGLGGKIVHDEVHPDNGYYSQNSYWIVKNMAKATIIGRSDFCSPVRGNPCDLSSGAKKEVAHDTYGMAGLNLTRFYSSRGGSSNSFGLGWAGPFDYRFDYAENATGPIFVKPNGQTIKFYRQSNDYYLSVDNLSASVRMEDVGGLINASVSVDGIVYVFLISPDSQP